MQEKSSQRTASAFAWDDPFLLEDQLGEDERLIRDTARGYAQEKLLWWRCPKCRGAAKPCDLTPMPPTCPPPQ